MKINAEEFEKKVIDSGDFCIVDFYADWCGPCKMLAPMLEKMEEQGYRVYKVNVDECMELAARYGVSSIPTVLFMRDGEVLSQSVGYLSYDELSELAATYEQDKI